MLLTVIFVLAFFLRFYDSWMPYFIDDDTDWILFANSISFNPKDLCLLPFGSGHGPLTAYLVKISGLLFGEHAFGWRVFSVVFGFLIIIMIYLLTKEGLGKREALFAAFLSSVNILFIFYSKYATDDIYSLFFFALTILFFWRALARESFAYVFLTGAALGFGLLTKESIALLFPVFLIFILGSDKFRVWLRKKEVYLSICLAFLISAPYLYWLFKHKLYFFLPGVKEAGLWFKFLNFPSAIIYLFLGHPELPFNKEYALGYHYIGPVIGLICFLGVIYSLKNLKNEFIRLMNLLFCSIVFCEILFFKGIPRQFIIIVIPGIILGASLLTKLWDKGALIKVIIAALLTCSLIYSLRFTWKLSRYYYPLHSQVSIFSSGEKYAKTDLNYLAKEFINIIKPFNPSLIIFNTPGLDPIDNFVNAYLRVKTIGTSPENRYLPYKQKDLSRILIFANTDIDLTEYIRWGTQNGYNISKEEIEIFLNKGQSLLLEIALLVRTKSSAVSSEEITRLVSISMPQI